MTPLVAFAKSIEANRAAFEAWADALPDCLPPAPKAAAWKAWQAAVKHERAECAKVCEDQGEAAERGHFCMGNGKWAMDCAAAIRARSA